MAIKVIICLVLGYIFGCFQTGYFYGKLFKGIDVRNYGSGNAGTTNTLRTLGKPAGYIVFLGDALKAVFAVWIVRYLLFPGLGDVTKILETVTALGVVIGHNYPFYMHFKGGKGIAATFGCFLGLLPHWIPLCVLAGIFIFFSCVVKINPNYYRTVATYILAAICTVWLEPNHYIVFGFLLIAASVLAKLFMSAEEKEHFEVKLAWKH